MAKQFSSPQEIEAAEEEVREEQEAAQQESQEEPEVSGQREQEEPETSESDVEESGEGEAEDAEVPEGEEALDDILSQHEPEPEITEEESEEEPETPEESEVTAEDFDIDNDRMEEILTSPEKFQSFVKEIRDNAVAQAREEFQTQLEETSAQLREEILQNIPEVVQKSAERAQTVNQTREQFFEQNPALREKLPYVRDMTNRVSHQHPDWSAKQVLDEVAKRAHRDLNLSNQAQQREEERRDDPKFAGAGGRQSPSGSADNRGKQEKLMDDTFGR